MTRMARSEFLENLSVGFRTSAKHWWATPSRALASASREHPARSVRGRALACRPDVGPQMLSHWLERQLRRGSRESLRGHSSHLRSSARKSSAWPAAGSDRLCAQIASAVSTEFFAPGNSGEERALIARDRLRNRTGARGSCQESDRKIGKR